MSDSRPTTCSGEWLPRRDQRVRRRRARRPLTPPPESMPDLRATLDRARRRSGAAPTAMRFVTLRLSTLSPRSCFVALPYD